MRNVTSEGEPVKRGPLTTDIKDALRELGIQLSLLNHRVSVRLDLRNIDLDCLNVVHRLGPISPSALARHAGLHPATMTGILDRLERDRWIARERDPADRRAVRVRALDERNRELFALLSGMNAAMTDLCRDYEPAELELIAEFLHRTADAGRTATEALSSE